MNEALKIIEEYGIFPIVEVKDAPSVRSLVQTLVESGLPIVEIALRTDAALDAMKIVRDEYPDVLLGAGTILTPQSAKKAHEAGARFMLSPGFNPRVVEYCIDNGYTIVPGVCSPTQIEWAIERGLETVKYFPAEASGGLPYLAAMASPFKNIRFIPTGGITNANLASYLGFPNVVACGGTWIAREKLIAEKRFDEIKKLIDAAFDASMGFELRGIEIAGAGKEAGNTQALMNIFSNLTAPGSGLPFLIPSGMGNPQDITIVISTVNLKRAASYFTRKGLHSMKQKNSGAGDQAHEVFLGMDDACCKFKIIQKV